jgi:DNA-binding NarL/FixJ family response regulator
LSDDLPTRPVSVVIVGADALARGGLAAALAGRPDVAVLLAAAPGPPLDRALRERPPEVLIWDAADPSGEALPGDGALPVVALCSDAAAAAGALAAGAVAALARDGDPDRLAAAVYGALQGLVVLDEAFAAELLAPSTAPRDGLEGPLEALTPREREVLALLADGMSNRRVARRLGVSEHTAKFHVASILAKLDADSRTDAVVRAARLGLLVL